MFKFFGLFFYNTTNVKSIIINSLFVDILPYEIYQDDVFSKISISKHLDKLIIYCQKKIDLCFYSKTRSSSIKCNIYFRFICNNIITNLF